MPSKARKGSDSTDTTRVSQFDGETSTREWRRRSYRKCRSRRQSHPIRSTRSLSLWTQLPRCAAACHDLLFHAVPCSSGLLFPSFHGSKSSRSGAKPTELPVISAVRAPSRAKAPNSSNLLDDLCLSGIIDPAQGAGWAGLLSLLPDRGRPDSGGPDRMMEDHRSVGGRQLLVFADS